MRVSADIHKWQAPNMSEVPHTGSAKGMIWSPTNVYSRIAWLRYCSTRRLYPRAYGKQD